jgi:hypothetical protein
MRMVAFFLLTLATLALAGCTAQERMCTLIGCVDGLTVHFTGAQPASYTLEARAAGHEPVTVSCSSDQATTQCRLDETFLADFTPEEVTLHITWDGGEVERTVRPVYTESRPNGPDCPPVCRQGQVAIDLAN